MKIVLSNPIEIENEFIQVNALFEEGLTHFHLRKPDFSKREVEEYLKNIKPIYLKRVVLHSHHDLIKKYNMKGIHLRGKDFQLFSNDVLITLVKDLQKRGFTASASLHAFEEIESLPCRLDYAFLSPIFQSISKQDYPSAFSKDELANFFQQRKSKTPIVALGGVREENLEQLQQIGFAGIALLGSIWQS